MNVEKRRLDGIREQLRSFSIATEQDAVRYHHLIKQLPSDEAAIYSLFGTADHRVFRQPNVVFSQGARALKCFSHVIQQPLALWPQVPPSIGLGRANLSADAGYQSEVGSQFSIWADEGNQEALREMAESFGEEFGFALLCSANADVSQLRQLIPRAWYFSVGSVDTNRILSVLADVAESTGWVAYECTSEPRRCFAVFSQQSTSLCDRVREKLIQQGTDAFSIAMCHAQLNLIR
jgi:hypothetical protein